MLTPEQVAEIETRAGETRFVGPFAHKHAEELFTDRDELVRRLAKVREMAIQVAGSQRWCGLCHGHSDRIRPGISLFWREGEPERHTPDCPAAPVNGENA